MEMKTAGTETRKKQKPMEMSEDFLEIIRQWKKLEDETINNSETLMTKSDNPIVRMIMEMIKFDSQKHKVMQQLLIDGLTKEPLHLNPDELAPLAEEIKRHIEAESKSVDLASKALEQSELFVTRYILTLLLADEAKHHRLLGDLNEVMLKRATIFVT
ncbi:MAG: hypothetical protein M0Z61_05125 [Nitrospiraceae bacterium]|nr:hypothetical protein [Nitrospiraceae bacterium]